MGFSFEHTFAVRASADRVWAYLTDPRRVASALPGAAITGQNEDGSWAGTITMKVGPVAAKYRGTLRFEELDAAGRSARIAARGQDTTGRGGADMKMTSRLVERSPGETEVSIASDVNVTGILAQFGRGMIQDVSNQMFQRFTEAVRAELEVAATPVEAAAGGAESPSAPAAPPAPAPPIEVVSFGSRIAGRAALRLMSRPAFWLVVALLLLLLFFWLKGGSRG